MPRIEIEVPEDAINAIKRIWNSNQQKISEEVLRQLGWTELGIFAGDLLCLGFEIASDDPRKFILHMRERKAPIFRESLPGETARPEKPVDDLMKAYA